MYKFANSAVFFFQRNNAVVQSQQFALELFLSVYSLIELYINDFSLESDEKKLSPVLVRMRRYGVSALYLSIISAVVA